MVEQGFAAPEVCKIVRHHLSPAGLLGPHRACHAVDPRRVRQRDPAAVLLPGPGDAPCDQEPARHRGVAAAGPRRRRAPAATWIEPVTGVTLMSDGEGVYEAHSPEAVVDLLRSGQGVFAIAIDRVWSDVEKSVPKAKATHGPHGGRRRSVSAQPATEPLPSDAVRFAHASERQFARLLDFYQIAWAYEPTSFPIAWDREGDAGPAVHARLLPAGVRPLHRDHDAQPEARDEEEPEGAAAARALSRRSGARSSISATTCPW